MTNEEARDLVNLNGANFTNEQRDENGTDIWRATSEFGATDKKPGSSMTEAVNILIQYALNNI